MSERVPSTDVTEYDSQSPEEELRYWQELDPTLDKSIEEASSPAAENERQVPTGIVPTQEVRNEVQRLAERYQTTRAEREYQEYNKEYRYGEPYEGFPRVDGNVFRRLYDRFQHRRAYRRSQKEHQNNEMSREEAQKTLGIVCAAHMFIDQGKYTKYWQDSTK